MAHSKVSIDVSLLPSYLEGTVTLGEALQTQLTERSCSSPGIVSLEAAPTP